MPRATTLESEGISCWIASRDISTWREMGDVNARVARLLDETSSSSSFGFLRIESISGTNVRLQTVDFRERPPYPQKEFLVNVNGDGQITLIPEKNAPQLAS
jgi:hypothetical protein